MTSVREHVSDHTIIKASTGLLAGRTGCLQTHGLLADAQPAMSAALPMMRYIHGFHFERRQVSMSAYHGGFQQFNQTPAVWQHIRTLPGTRIAQHTDQQAMWKTRGDSAVATKQHWASL